MELYRKLKERDNRKDKRKIRIQITIKKSKSDLVDKIICRDPRSRNQYSKRRTRWLSIRQGVKVRIIQMIVQSFRLRKLSFLKGWFTNHSFRKLHRVNVSNKFEKLDFVCLCQDPFCSHLIKRGLDLLRFNLGSHRTSHRL